MTPEEEDLLSHIPSGNVSKVAHKNSQAASHFLQENLSVLMQSSDSSFVSELQPSGSFDETYISTVVSNKNIPSYSWFSPPTRGVDRTYPTSYPLFPSQSLSTRTSTTPTTVTETNNSSRGTTISIPPKVETIQRQLGLNDSQKWNANRATGRFTGSVSHTPIPSNKRTLPTTRHRDHTNVYQRGNRSLRSNFSTSKHSLLVLSNVRRTKERRETSPSHRLSRVERVHSQNSFPDGKPSHSQKFITPERMDGKNRHEGRLFPHSHTRELTRLATVHMEGHPLPFQSPSLRNNICPTNLHKDDETCHCTDQSNGYSVSHLPGRHISYQSYQRRGNGACNDRPPHPHRVWSDHQLGKINVNSNSNLRISGSDSRLCSNGIPHSQTEKEITETGTPSLPDNLQVETDCNSQVSSFTGGKTQRLRTSGISSSRKNQHNDETKEHQPTPWLGRSPPVDRRSRNRASMVAPKHVQMERKINLTPNSRSLLHLRRLHDRLGWNLRSGHGDIRSLVRVRERIFDKLSRIDRRSQHPSKLRGINLRRSSKLGYGQHHSSLVHQPTRRQRRGIESNSSIPLELVSRQEHTSSSLLPSRNAQPKSRQTVQEETRQKRLETKSSSVLNARPTMGPSRNRPVRILPKQTNPKVLQLSSPTRNMRSQRVSTIMETPKRLGEPSLLIDSQSVEQGPGRQMYNNNNSTLLDHAGLVPRTNEDAGRFSTTTTTIFGPVPSRSTGQRNTPSSILLESNRLSYLRSTSTYRDIPEAVFKFITRRWSTGTGKNYDSAWKRFAEWWNSQQFPDNTITEARVAQFLVNMFQAGFSAGQLNAFRSAISVTTESINGYPVGKLPLVSAIISAAQKERPSEPRYESTWNLQNVLDYIRRVMPNNEALPLVELRRKCGMLLRLAIIGRTSDVHRIYYSTLKFQEGKCYFSMRPLKNHQRRKLGQHLDNFDTDPAICPVRALKAYVDRTSHIIRPDDRIFLAQHAPFKEIGTETMAKDVLKILTAAGIDTSKFKAHSTRAAAATRALDAGATVEEVMEAGRWLSFSVFQEFYNRSKRKSNFTQMLFGPQQRT